MTENSARYHRATVVLGAASVLSGGYVLLSPPTPLNIIHAGLGGAVVLIILGAVAIVGGAVVSARPLALVAGVALVVAALFQLVSLVAEPLRILGGDASLTAVLAGFGIGLTLVSLTARHDSRR